MREKNVLYISKNPRSVLESKFPKHFQKMSFFRLSIRLGEEYIPFWSKTALYDCVKTYLAHHSNAVISISNLEQLTGRMPMSDVILQLKQIADLLDEYQDACMVISVSPDCLRRSQIKELNAIADKIITARCGEGKH